MNAPDHASLQARLDAIEADFGTASMGETVARLSQLVPELEPFPPLHARALNDLGVIAHAQGDRTGAMACLETALRLDPVLVDAMENLADLVADAGDLRQALGLRLQAVRERPADAALWVAVGGGAAACGEWPLALDAAARAGALDPGADGLATLQDQLAPHRASVTARRPGPGRLLVAAENFYPQVGGTERLAEDAAVSLRDLGWDVEIVTGVHPDRRGPATHRGLTVHEVPQGREVEGLARLVAATRPDAILSFSGPIAWPLVGPLVLPHPRPRAVVVPCINGDFDAQLRTGPHVLRQYAAYLAGAGAVGHSSLRGLDVRVCEELGLPPAYVPNAVVVADPDFAALDRAGLRRGDPFLLVVGNHWPEKNHLGLLAHLAESDYDRPIVFVGNPAPRYPELTIEIAAAAATDPRARLVGGATREEVAGLMQSAQALLLPSRVEATPLVVLEAMSHGLPWIATPTGGAVHEHAGGLIVELDRFLPTAQDLLADEARRVALGAEGREHWSACYTWDAIAPRYDALLRGARELPPLPAPAALAAA